MARPSSRSSEVSNAKDAHSNNGDTSTLIKPQAPSAPLAMEESSSSSSSSSSLSSSKEADEEREAAVRGRGRGRGRGGGSIRIGPATTTTATPFATTTTARGRGKRPASAALDSSTEGSPPLPGKATRGGKGRGRGGGNGRGRGRGRGRKQQQQRRVTFQANGVIIQSPRTKQEKRKHEGSPPVFTFKKATAVDDEDLTTASAATAVAASSLSPSSSTTSSSSSSAAGDDSPAQKKKTSRAPSEKKAVNEDGTGDYSGMGKAEDIDYFADVISTDDADDGEDGDVIKRDLLGLQHLMTRHFVDVSNLGTYPFLTPSHPTFDWNTAPARTTIKALAELINSHEAGLQTNHAVMSIGPLEVGKEDMSILASGSSIFLLTIGGDATLDLTSRGEKVHLFLKSGSLTKIGMKTAAAAIRVLTPLDQSAQPIITTFRCISRLHDPLKVLRTLSVNKPSKRTTASRVASLVNK